MTQCLCNTGEALGTNIGTLLTAGGGEDQEDMISECWAGLTLQGNHTLAGQKVHVESDGLFTTD